MRFESLYGLRGQVLLHVEEEIEGPAGEYQLFTPLGDEMRHQVAQGRFARVVLGRQEADDFVEARNRQTNLLILNVDGVDDLVSFLFDAGERFFDFLGHACLLFGRGRVAWMCAN